ncbi:MAG: septal ring lytic transglycosylase RlpA family protein [Pseudomonadota bacterium]
MLRVLGLALAILLPTIASADVPRLQMEEAIASYYGPGFHGRRTASGARFDSWASTAAHRTLPFGARIRVLNPANGRAEEVVITDRGPFKPGRDFDLSAGTATRLGLRERGVGRVLVQRLP